MIKKALRFSQKEIDFFIKTPHKKIGNDLFVFRYKKSETLKIGVILSKKSYKTSVERNKIKRILYDELFKMCPKTGFFVISPQKNILPLKKEEIKSNLEYFLKQVC
mgnify:CR=1 FL=1